jgi:hypothetical protein
MMVVMKPGFLVVELPGESQVHRGLLPIPVRILIGQRTAKRIALPLPDQFGVFIAGGDGGVEVVGFEVEHLFRCAVQDDGDRDVVAPDIGSERSA